MHAHLMGASGFKAAFHQRGAVQRFEQAEMGDGMFAALWFGVIAGAAIATRFDQSFGHQGHALAISGVAGDHAA